MNAHKPNVLALVLLSLGLVIFLVITFIFVSYNKKEEVKIATTPKGAHYKIGSLEGETPASVKLKAGEYKIELSKDKYETLVTSFKVRTFGDPPSLSYKLTLKRLGLTNDALPKERLEEGFSRKAPEDLEKKQEAVNKKYSFYYKLPYKDDSKYFYISKPTYDDKFFVYVSKVNPDEGKRRALEWFDGNGVANPEKNLTIVWQYR